MKSAQGPCGCRSAPRLPSTRATPLDSLKALSGGNTGSIPYSLPFLCHFVATWADQPRSLTPRSAGEWCQQPLPCSRRPRPFDHANPPDALRFQSVAQAIRRVRPDHLDGNYRATPVTQTRQHRAKLGTVNDPRPQYAPPTRPRVFEELDPELSGASPDQILKDSLLGILRTPRRTLRAFEQLITYSSASFIAVKSLERLLSGPAN